MKQKIRFVVIVVEWFDKVNGNTYQSIRITRTRDEKVICCRCECGYAHGETALNAMEKAKWIPLAFRGRRENGSRLNVAFERENNNPILWSVHNGTKKECVENGEA